MKRFLCVLSVILILTLIVTIIPANPLKPIILSELLFDNDGGWHMEIGQTLSATNLDGWYLKSKTDSASFRDGIRIGIFDYLTISNDSLKKPLFINPLGDSISVFSSTGSGFPMDILSFGKEGWKSVSAPRYGQSICQDQQGYYLDNTPTPGAANNYTNATGTIMFLVQDSLARPIAAADISFYYSSDNPGMCCTNDSGIASASVIARRKSFAVRADGYLLQYVWAQVYPDSIITVPVKLAVAPDAVKKPETTGTCSFDITNPYPNPFNPEVTIEYTLPHSSMVEIQIYDVAGRMVAEICPGKKPAGKNVARWAAEACPSGVYLIRVRTADGMSLKKCLLLK